MYRYRFRIVITFILLLQTACSISQPISTKVSPQLSPTTLVPSTISSEPTPTSLPPDTSTPTLSLDMWTTYSNPAFAISLEYPADWQPVTGYGSPETGEIRFEASNGFFQIGAMDTESLDLAAAAEAGHKLQPYGAQPTIEKLVIQNQEARLVSPSDVQPTGMYKQAVLIVRYPHPVNVLGTPCRFFVLWSDVSHIRTIAQTLTFTD